MPLVPGEAPTALPRKSFGVMAAVGVSLSILNSPIAASGSLSTVLSSGGPEAVVWGMVSSWVGILCMALSLAEIAAVLPIWSGVSSWAYLLCAPPGLEYTQRRVALSYITAWINGAGWIAVTASASSIFASFITGIISLCDSSYEVKNWHTFLIYLALTIAAWFVNVFGIRLLDMVNRASLMWMVTGVTVMSITCLACSSGDFQPGHFVFASFVNQTGWPDGVAWIMGLLQSAFSLTGIDGVLHIAEEVSDPAKIVPAIMCAAVMLGASMALVFLIILLFCLRNYDQVIESSAGPLLEILYQATSNKAGAICLNMFPLVSMCFAAMGILTAASRVIHSLAMDRALFFHRWWQYESPTLHTPVLAITFVSFWVFVFDLIYLGSSEAFSAILDSSVINFQISYIVPVVIIMIRGRGILDAYVPEGQTRRWNLGKCGPVVNTIAVAFNLVTTVFFFFPSAVPVKSGNSMNWTVLVEAVIVILCILTWVFEARRHFNGPTTTIHPEIVEIATGVRPEQHALPFPYNDFADKHITSVAPVDLGVEDKDKDKEAHSDSATTTA